MVLGFMSTSMRFRYQEEEISTIMITSDNNSTAQLHFAKHIIIFKYCLARIAF